MNPSSNGPQAAPRVAVVQDGARLHYAVPLALHRSSMLERMFTEWYSAGSAAAAARLVGVWDRAAGAKLRGRYCAGLPPSLIHTNPGLAIRLRMARGKFPDAEHYFEWCSAQVARWVRRTGWGKANTLFGFVRNIHPSLCEAARQDGLSVVVDQMCASACIEQRYKLRERARWPEWVLQKNEPHVSFVSDIESRTWATVDHITCASDFVRRGLIEHGVGAERISVCPYPIQVNHLGERRFQKRPPVTVGFVGAVGLWKGCPYFLSVAQCLAGPGARFVMVGRVDVPTNVRKTLSQTVELVGPVPRSRVETFLQEFDIFFFPSTCEGSAGAVMEAMAAGLPVVTTPNSGSLVVDGVHGFVRPSGDIDGMAEAVERLIRDPELRMEMGLAGQAEARRNSVDAYAKRFRESFEYLLASDDRTQNN